MQAKPLPNITDPAGTRPRRRRLPRLAAVAVAVVTLATTHAAAWIWLTGELRDGVAAWAALRRAEGWQVGHGPPARGGWPFAVALTVPDVALRRAGTGWQAETVALTLAWPGLDRLRVAPAGRQALELDGTVMPMAAEGLVADLPLGRDALGIAGLPRDAALRAERLSLDLPAGPVALAALRLDLASSDGLRPGDPLAALRGMAASLTLPPALAALPGLAVLGPRLDRLSLDVAVSGPWPGLSGSPSARAARWRDGGGTLELRGLAFGWGAANASATATFALDAVLQPAGAGTLRLAGGAAVLEAAREAGMIGRREVATAQMLLAMMQRVPPEGGPPRLEVPLVLEQRTLVLAGLTLLRLPGLAWPTGVR